MTKWDISPNGVRGVLGQTHAVASQFDAQVASLDAALRGAVAQSGSGIVAQAVQGFLQAKQADVRFVFTRTSACMNAAAQATNHYVQGDLEMAANAQAAASAAPDPRAALPGGGARPR
ncbi:DUF6507 family protein [Saccharothrix sp. S26]|uniref:DUF6507 family protein n=1 Tax=Saccharothrix sp. S26 TaxID=2907215 RepID=UPI001F361CE8|nr:DUF6507 family protein [Saccharothrix sp. S26]MCE6996890.1 DUF6507 family protein [Saccharothrix sp. S26]